MELTHRPARPPYLRYKDPDFYAHIYGLMKLSDKYQLTSISKVILERLDEDWPKTLLAVLRLQADADFLRSSNLGSIVSTGIYWSRIGSALPDPATAIRLANDFNIPSILPTAFYLLATEDSTMYNKTGKPNKGRDRSNSYPSWTIRWDLLSESDMLRYYQGKELLLQELKRVHSVFSIEHTYCEGEDQGVFT